MKKWVSRRGVWNEPEVKITSRVQDATLAFGRNGLRDALRVFRGKDLGVHVFQQAAPALVVGVEFLVGLLFCFHLFV